MVALTFAIIIPAGILLYNFSLESSAEVEDSQVIQVGRSIIEAAQTVFYYGPGSKTVIDVNMPGNVLNILVIDGKEIVFNVTTSYGFNELVFFSPINISTAGSNCNANVCSFPEIANSGLKKIKLEAKKDTVIMQKFS